MYMYIYLSRCIYIYIWYVYVSYHIISFHIISYHVISFIYRHVSLLTFSSDYFQRFPKKEVPQDPGSQYINSSLFHRDSFQGTTAIFNGCVTLPEGTWPKSLEFMKSFPNLTKLKSSGFLPREHDEQLPIMVTICTTPWRLKQRNMMGSPSIRGCSPTMIRWTPKFAAPRRIKLSHHSGHDLT